MDRPTPQGTNARTLQAYETAAPSYHDNTFSTVQGTLKTWLDAAVEPLQKTARILEIGSGAGRDARYLIEKGYPVVCTEATAGMADQLRATGLECELLDVLQGPVKGSWDLILANCVFLHFADEEFVKGLRNVHEALVSGGVLAIGMKEGDGEVWVEEKNMPPRFMRYWRQEALTQLLTECGFKVYGTVNSEPLEGDHPRIRLLCKKVG